MNWSVQGVKVDPEYVPRCALVDQSFYPEQSERSPLGAEVQAEAVRDSQWGDEERLSSKETDSCRFCLPGGSDSQESACNAAHPSSIPGWEDPLEEGMAIHSSILAWKITWTEEPGGLQSPWGWQTVGHDWATNTFTFSTQWRAGKHLCYHSHTQQGHTCMIISCLVLLWHLLKAKYLIFLPFP